MKNKKERRLVLFVCMHNRFRSKVAEALFNKYIKQDKNKSKKFRAFSRGFKLDKDAMYVAANVKKVLRRFGIRQVDNTPRKLAPSDLRRADIIVVSADNVKLPKKLVRGRKIIYWKISDVSQNNYKGILSRARIIKGKVKGLVGGLKLR
jgi:protein-tyrosine-phosphatase